MKTCTKCKTEKPKTEFSKRSAAQDGLHPHCRRCANDANRAWHESNPERTVLRRKKYRDENRDKCIEAGRKWRAENPEKSRNQCRAWAEKNKDKIREAKKIWISANADMISATRAKWMIKNPGRAAASCKRWREANPERQLFLSASWRIANPCRAAETSRLWRINNRESRAACERNRKARKKNSEGAHTAADILEILTAQRGLCANCQIKLVKSGKNKYHVDHIMPLIRGGDNDKYNLQCLCPSCNLRKSAKHPYDWAKENGKLC